MSVEAMSNTVLPPKPVSPSVSAGSSSGLGVQDVSTGVSPLPPGSSTFAEGGSVSSRSHHEAAARAKQALEKEGNGAGSMSARTHNEAAARATAAVGGGGASSNAVMVSPSNAYSTSTRSYTEVVSRVVKLWEQHDQQQQHQQQQHQREHGSSGLGEQVQDSRALPPTSKHDAGLPAPAATLTHSWTSRRVPLIKKMNVRDKYEVGEEVGRGNWSRVFAAQLLGGPESSGSVTEAEGRERRSWFSGRRSRRSNGTVSSSSSALALAGAAAKEEDSTSQASSGDEDVLPVEHVVVKLIDKIKLGSRDAMETPQKEVEALHCLSSCCPSHVVRLVEAMEDNWSYSLVLERCHGGQLNKELSPRGGKLTEEETKVVMRSVLLTLAYCSLHGIVHRDVKLENLLLAQRRDLSTVKLSDFGLAVFLPPGGTISGCMGTAPYAAPEVVQGHPYDTTADMWSAGVVAYTLLAGGKPFWAQKLSQVLHAVVHEELKFDGKAWEDLSPEAVDFLRMLLHKNWRKRPSAAQALCHPWIFTHAVGDSLPLDSRILFPPPLPLGQAKDSPQHDSQKQGSLGMHSVEEGKCEGADNDIQPVAGAGKSTLTAVAAASLRAQLADKFVALQQLCVAEFKDGKDLSKPQKARVKALSKLGREGLRAEIMEVLTPILEKQQQ